MQSTVLGDLNLPIRSYVLEVLIAEDKDLPLRGVQCELIETVLAQLGDLHTGDLGPNKGAQMADICLGRQQVWLCTVRLSTGIRVLYL